MDDPTPDNLSVCDFHTTSIYMAILGLAGALCEMVAGWRSARLEILRDHLIMSGGSWGHEHCDMRVTWRAKSFFVLSCSGGTCFILVTGQLRVGFTS